MAKPELKRAFEKHLEETRRQVEHCEMAAYGTARTHAALLCVRPHPRVEAVGASCSGPIARGGHDLVILRDGRRSGRVLGTLHAADHVAHARDLAVQGGDAQFGLFVWSVGDDAAEGAGIQPHLHTF